MQCWMNHAAFADVEPVTKMKKTTQMLSWTQQMREPHKQSDLFFFKLRIM